MIQPTRSWLIATICIAFNSAALADTVDLANGDRLTGTVIDQSAGKLTIDTPYAGKVTVTTGDINNLSIDAPMQYTLDSGQTVQGTAKTIADGTVMITGTDGKLLTIPSLATISGIGDIPPTGPQPLEWRGHAQGGGNITKGNTRTDALNIGARLVGEQKGFQRVTGYANYYADHTGDRRTKEQYLAGAKYDRFFDEKWYGYVGADFEKNSFKDLDLRSIFSIGVGHQFWDTDAKRLSVEGGLSYIDEDFKRDSDDSYLALGWGVNYEQIFYDGAIKFFHHHRGLQGFKDIDDTIINAQTGAFFPLFGGLNASVIWGLDWDKSPPDGTKETDHSLTFGVAYDW
ncbi:MAG: DUF481 domain-containing protein [Gammaproteobacteria bacterium]